MNFLVTGLLWSGSSAVLDMLKEYKNIAILPGEFDEFRRPGMVADHADGRINSYFPSQINNYLKKKQNPEYLSRKNLVKNEEFHKRLRAIDRFSERVQSVENKKELAFLAQEWFDELKKIYIKDREHLVIDQPLLICQHEDVWPSILSPFKLIIVYRDPRDQIAQIIKQNHLFLYTTSSASDIYGGGRLGAIKLHLHTLKVRLDFIGEIRKKHGEKKVAIISFEKLIKEHDLIRGKLEEWLGIDSDNRVKEILKPHESMRNIGIYKDILSKEEIVLLEDSYNDYLIREKENDFY